MEISCIYTRRLDDPNITRSINFALRVEFILQFYHFLNLDIHTTFSIAIQLITFATKLYYIVYCS